MSQFFCSSDPRAEPSRTQREVLLTLLWPVFQGQFQQQVEQTVEVPIPMQQERREWLSKVYQSELLILFPVRLRRRLAARNWGAEPFGTWEISFCHSVLNCWRQEEVVHVPKVITQQRVQHQQVEQTVEVPVPMMQDPA